MHAPCTHSACTGFGAAKHLSEQGYAVTLVDASPNPGGLSAGWRTPQGRTVEAGFKGFWYQVLHNTICIYTCVISGSKSALFVTQAPQPQYANIFSLVRELGIEWPFTPFTTSGFWSPSGLTTEAPVFSEKIRLPTMLGQFVWTAQLPWTISIPDRLTMFNMLYPVIDFDSDKDTYEKYDTMSAYDLFRQWGISKEIYEKFLKPTCASPCVCTFIVVHCCFDHRFDRSIRPSRRAQRGGSAWVLCVLRTRAPGRL